MSKKNAMKNVTIRYLFLDIGGILLTNGWDHHACKRAAINTDYKSTNTRLASFGLHNYEGAIHETS
ncbi:MAG: hypothetical protein WA678_05630 [Rhabdochlamydiaceae bacterium]